MKHIRTLLTVLSFPLMLMACPADDEDEGYGPPEYETPSGSIMGPNASIQPIHFDTPYEIEVG